MSLKLSLSQFAMAFAFATMALAVSSQGHAYTVDFTTAEGYPSTLESLNGEPGVAPLWDADSSWDVNGSESVAVSNRGFNSNNLAAVYQSAIAADEGATINLSVDFQFAGLGANSGSSRYVFGSYLGSGNSAADSGSNYGRVIFARLANSSNYVVYFATGVSGNGFLGAQYFSPASIGDNGTLDDLTDNLNLSVSMTKGSALDDWAVEFTLTNLDASTIVASESILGVETTATFYNSSELYGSFLSMTSQNNGGTSQLTVDQVTGTSIPEPKAFSLYLGGAMLATVFLATGRRRK